jgi:ankyrin repeat protein
MDAKQLPARPSLEQLRSLAEDFLKAYQSGDSAALRRIQDHYQRPVTWDELRQSSDRRRGKRAGEPNPEFVLDDARLLVADSHGFESWTRLEKHAEALLSEHSPVSKFESAADAIIAGDIATLQQLLRANPELVRSRSTRAHRSTLLHYVSANGVEDFRQKTPPNIVEVARLLLGVGAEVDAENNPGRGTALGLVATSYHPAAAGVQIALLEALLEAGASPDGLPDGWNPLNAALANGRGDAAGFLAGRGARLDLEGAAGVGRLDVLKSFFTADDGRQTGAERTQLLSAFAWACEYGRTSVVDFLLQKGIAVDAKLRHDGQTGLHWAAYHGHVDTVKLLLARSAPVNAKDESYHGTPLGWALYAWGAPPPEANLEGYYEVVALLVAGGAIVDQDWLADPNRERPLVEKVRADRRMVAALAGGLPPQ